MVGEFRYSMVVPLISLIINTFFLPILKQVIAKPYTSERTIVVTSEEEDTSFIM
jgi:hypothetical protein